MSPLKQNYSTRITAFIKRDGARLAFRKLGRGLAAGTAILALVITGLGAPLTHNPYIQTQSFHDRVVQYYHDNLCITSQQNDAVPPQIYKWIVKNFAAMGITPDAQPDISIGFSSTAPLPPSPAPLCPCTSSQTSIVRRQKQNKPAQPAL